MADNPRAEANQPMKGDTTGTRQATDRDAEITLLRRDQVVDGDAVTVGNEISPMERNHHLALRAEISTALLVGEHLPVSLRQCGDALCDHLDMSLVQLWLGDDAATMALASSCGPLLCSAVQERLPIERASLSRLLQQRTTQIFNSVDQPWPTPTKNWATLHEIKAFASYPLAAGDRLVGALTLFSRRPFSQAMLSVLETVAGLLAVGIDRKIKEETRINQPVSVDVAEQHQVTRDIQASEARTRGILDSALDSIITINHEGRVVEFNPAAEATFGYDRAAAIGRELAELIIPPRLRERHRQGLARFMATGEASVLGKRLELPAMRADGTELLMEVAITRLALEGPSQFTAYLRDISRQKQAEENRNARLAAAQVLSQATSLEEGVRGVIEAVCQSLNWDMGCYWSIEGDSLHCCESWRRESESTEKFANASALRIFRKGEGLPGRVWESGRPAWIGDVTNDSNFIRMADAQELGFHSAFACPVILGQRTLGIFEFFTHSNREPDEDLLEMMATIAASVAQFSERREAEEKLRRSEYELSDFFENAVIGMHWVSADGTILRANRAELELLGYSVEEYVGHNIAEFHADPAAVDEILQRLKASERLRDYSANIRCKDGSIRQVLIHCSAWFENGEFVHSRCFIRDVTDRNRAEAALKQSEEMWRQMADTIPQLAWMARPDGHIYWYNQRWYDFTGTTSEQMSGWGWQSVHDSEALPAVLKEWKHSISTGTPFDMVFPLRRADGVFCTFLTRVMPLRAESGEIRHWFGTNTDITALRETREALATSEERLRLALDAGRMGVWDWNVRTGEIDWSDSLEPLHGLQPGTFGRTFEAFQALIHPDDSAMVQQAIRRTVDEQIGYDIEFRNIWPNGSVHWIAGKGKALYDQNNTPERMIGICLDVTHRKRIEQTARFLADASGALAVLVDFDSTLQTIAGLAVPYFADWATVDLVESDGSLRRVAVAHVDPAKIELAHEFHRRFVPSPEVPHGAWRIVETGQAELVPEITDDLLIQTTRDPQLLAILRELGLKSYIGVPLIVRGKIIGAITFISAESGHRYDDTDLAVAQDLASRAAIAIENGQLYGELREADRRKDEFLATLAHELRNPLAPIRNGLQVMQLAGSEQAIAVEARTMMERQLAQLVRLVDDLLDVSRITRNKLELRKQRVELAAVIHSAVETSRPLIERAGHALSMTLPPNVYLEADFVRLAQVFSNLLNNCAKYTEAGGKIWLAAETTDSHIVVSVRDTGLGIPQEALPKIFEMFSQVDRNLERSQGGLGIGLTLVRRLVELHGGSVEARSDGPGLGSEFIVRLPRLESETAKVPDASSGRSPLSADSARRILVVDDNKDAAMSLVMILKFLGNQTDSAHDGLEAIEVADRFRPDIILLDIGLPKLNGYETCQKIREQPWGKGILIVALTGWGQEEDRRRSSEAGFDHHMVKPIEMELLQRVLDSAPGKAAG